MSTCENMKHMSFKKKKKNIFLQIELSKIKFVIVQIN